MHTTSGYASATAPPPARERLLAATGLLWNTAVWGLSFVLIRDAVAHTAPLLFVAIRFAAALAALAVAVRLRGLKRPRLRESLRPGVIAGAALFGGFVLQTLGLRYTTAAKAAFITGLSVVIVPLFARVLLGDRLRRRTAVTLPLAVAGLALLAFERGIDAPSAGDLLVLGCAVSFALQITLVARFASAQRRLDPLALTLWEVATVAVAAGVFMPSGGVAIASAEAWAAAVGLGLIATAGAYVIEVLAQRRLGATRTALVYTAEPLFAAIFAAGLGGERLGAGVLAGGGCIVCAMLLGS